MEQVQWPIKQKLGIEWARDPLLNQTGLVLQGFCGRKGGKSQGTYEALNISFSTSDTYENICANRQLLAEALGFPLSSWTGIHQVHGNRVVRVEQKDAGQGGLDSGVLLKQADGQITNVPGVTLISQHADCLALYFLDPVHKAIGLSHAGWKGTLLNIAGETIQAMEEAYGTRPSDLLVAIGPGAGPCHYEVDEPVIKRVKEVFSDREIEQNQLMVYTKEIGKAMLDLGACNRLLLLQAGLQSEHISLAGICTICAQKQFFSHRCGAGGRQAAVLRLLV